VAKPTRFTVYYRDRTVVIPIESFHYATAPGATSSFVRPRWQLLVVSFSLRSTPLIVLCFITNRPSSLLIVLVVVLIVTTNYSDDLKSLLLSNANSLVIL
jgi:hypothetical protein